VTTHFRSSSDALNRVWELSKYTITGASLDVNTDSNTRQRDVCTWDAYLAAHYQQGVAALTAAPLQRRVVEWMYEPGSYVNTWTEFQVAHVFALYDYTFRTGDTTLAEARLGDAEPYSLLSKLNWSNGHVYGTPKPLVDWPRSKDIDIDEKAASACAPPHACAAMNAHVATALHDMSAMASLLKREADAERFHTAAAVIAGNITKGFGVTGSACNPPAPACFVDNLERHTTSLHSTLFPLSVPSELR